MPEYILSQVSGPAKIILGCIFYAPLVGMVFLSIFFSIQGGPSAEQQINEMDSLAHANSVVDTLFNDDRNHNVRTAILKNHQTFYILSEWESHIETGDLLFKKKGSFLLDVYKKNGKKIVLDYKNPIAVN